MSSGFVWRVMNFLELTCVGISTNEGKFSFHVFWTNCLPKRIAHGGGRCVTLVIFEFKKEPASPFESQPRLLLDSLPGTLGSGVVGITLGLVSVVPGSIPGVITYLCDFSNPVVGESLGLDYQDTKNDGGP
eukprot:scaffold139964_cov65-Attheya_sp.AAC.1